MPFYPILIKEGNTISMGMRLLSKEEQAVSTFLDLTFPIFLVIYLEEVLAFRLLEEEQQVEKEVVEEMTVSFR